MKYLPGCKHAGINATQIQSLPCCTYSLGEFIRVLMQSLLIQLTKTQIQSQPSQHWQTVTTLQLHNVYTRPVGTLLHTLSESKNLISFIIWFHMIDVWSSDFLNAWEPGFCGASEEHWRACQESKAAPPLWRGSPRAIIHPLLSINGVVGS